MNKSIKIVMSSILLLASIDTTYPVLAEAKHFKVTTKNVSFKMDELVNKKWFSCCSVGMIPLWLLLNRDGTYYSWDAQEHKSDIAGFWRYYQKGNFLYLMGFSSKDSKQLYTSVYNIVKLDKNNLAMNSTRASAGTLIYVNKGSDNQPSDKWAKYQNKDLGLTFDYPTKYKKNDSNETITSWSSTNVVTGFSNYNNGNRYAISNNVTLYVYDRGQPQDSNEETKLISSLAKDKTTINGLKAITIDNLYNNKIAGYTIRSVTDINVKSKLILRVIVNFFTEEDYFTFKLSPDYLKVMKMIHSIKVKS